MKIYNIIGPRGAGKDTLGDILIKNNLVNEKISFAAPLKEICKKVFKLGDYQVDDPKGKQEKLTFPLFFFDNVAESVFEEMNNYVANSGKLSIQAKNLNGLMRSPREVLQFVGTDFIRNHVDPDWHIKAAFSNLNEGTYVVTDCRFMNEYKYLNNNYEVIKNIYVERPEAEENLNKSKHMSELEIKRIRQFVDFELKNVSSIEDLKTEILDRLGEK